MIKLTDLLNEGNEHKLIAKILSDISSETVTDPMEFSEYIIDYYNNPEDYGIDEDSMYYDAIATTYWQVKDHYRISNVPGIKNSPMFKKYSKL